MTTSISSEALSYIGTEKITFTPKPDGQTERHTDIIIYIVASLLKIHRRLLYLEESGALPGKMLLVRII